MMMRVAHFKILGIVLIVLLVSNCNPKDTAIRPNIVFIQLNEDGEELDSGCGGINNGYVLNSIKRQSLVFESLYMYPEENASSVALLSGKHPFKSGFSLGGDISQESYNTYLDKLKSVGYYCVQYNNHQTKYPISEFIGLVQRKVEHPFFIDVKYSFSSDNKKIHYTDRGKLRLDYEVEKLLGYLDKEGLRNNTLIIFSIRQPSKTQINGGLCVKTFFYWPGKINARRTKAVVAELDFYPTFMELAGIVYKKEEFDGESLCDLFLQDENRFKNRSLMWLQEINQNKNSFSVIQKGHYKLAQNLSNGQFELYDLKNDSIEIVNVTTKNRGVATELLNELVEWRKVNYVNLPENSNLKY